LCENGRFLGERYVLTDRVVLPDCSAAAKCVAVRAHCLTEDMTATGPDGVAGRCVVNRRPDGQREKSAVNEPVRGSGRWCELDPERHRAGRAKRSPLGIEAVCLARGEFSRFAYIGVTRTRSLLVGKREPVALVTVHGSKAPVSGRESKPNVVERSSTFHVRSVSDRSYIAPPMPPMPPIPPMPPAPPSSPSPEVERSPAAMMSSILSTRFAASVALESACSFAWAGSTMPAS